MTSAALTHHMPAIASAAADDWREVTPEECIGYLSRLSVSEQKARGALRPSSNGLPAINNPSSYSTADQTKFIALIHMFGLYSEPRRHATDRIALVFGLKHVHESNCCEALLSAALRKEFFLHMGNVWASL